MESPIRNAEISSDIEVLDTVCFDELLGKIKEKHLKTDDSPIYIWGKRESLGKVIFRINPGRWRPPTRSLEEKWYDPEITIEKIFLNGLGVDFRGNGLMADSQGLITRGFLITKYSPDQDGEVNVLKNLFTKNTNNAEKIKIVGITEKAIKKIRTKMRIFEMFSGVPVFDHKTGWSNSRIRTWVFPRHPKE